MGRGVSSGGGQSSLGYLFGSDGTPKPAANQTTAADNTACSQKPYTASPPVDGSRQIPAGIQQKTANNYHRADGQNSGNFLTVQTHLPLVKLFTTYCCFAVLCLIFAFFLSNSSWHALLSVQFHFCYLVDWAVTIIDHKLWVLFFFFIFLHSSLAWSISPWYQTHERKVSSVCKTISALPVAQLCICKSWDNSIRITCAWKNAPSFSW